MQDCVEDLFLSHLEKTLQHIPDDTGLATLITVVVRGSDDSPIFRASVVALLSMWNSASFPRNVKGFTVYKE